MSNLSALLNPAGPATQAGVTQQANAEGQQDQHQQHRSPPAFYHQQSTNGPHTSLNSPLDALATAAAMSSVPMLSPLQPASAPALQQSFIRSSPRPTSSHFPLPRPFETSRSSDHPFSPGLEQYHHSSHHNTGGRRLSEIADGLSRELPPLRHSVDLGGSPPVTTMREGNAHEYLKRHSTADAQSASHSLHRALDEPIDTEAKALGSEPVTSQIRQPSPDTQKLPSIADHMASESLQAKVKTEVNEEPLPVNMQDAPQVQVISPQVAPEPVAAKEELATPKPTTDLKREDSARASSVATDGASRATPLKPKSAASKKRAAPATTKKGTAKPAVKKRKIHDVSNTGTPSLPRFGTPASSRASKTPVPSMLGNYKEVSATPTRSSSVGEGDGDDDDDIDESQVFCLCRKPDDHTWMIGCEAGCDEWFHGRCVNLSEKDGQLIDRYVCPNCTENGLGQTTWKPLCRLDGCREPARVSGSNPSKYCNDAHGEAFMEQLAVKNKIAEKTTAKNRRRSNRADHFGNGDDAMDTTQSLDEEDHEQTHLRGGVLRASELKALTNGVKDVDEFRKLGDGILSPPKTASPNGVVTKIENSETVTYTDEENNNLSRITDKKENLRRRRAMLDDRDKFLSLVRNRGKSVLEELKQKENVKDICGYDSRLSWSDEEFESWRSSPEGQKALTNAVLGPPPANLHTDTTLDGQDGAIGRGVCQKKRCERHKAWYKLQQQEMAFERETVRQEMKRLGNDEKGIRDRAMIRHLEAADSEPMDAGATV